MKLGIDVSSYNGKIDWYKVKRAGYEFAVIKVIRKDLSPDTAFNANWEGCEVAGIDIQGVYNYSYATSPQKARSDARAVAKVLNGRKAMVWLDVEDKCQMNLGSKLIDIILAYKDEIERVGLTFGLYTGYAFYNSYLKKYADSLANIPLWIARYGANNGTRNVKYQPQIDGMVGWQFTSKGSVNGIKGNVDLNVFYTFPESKTEKSNPYVKPTRVLSAKKVLGRWSCRGNDVKWVQYELFVRGYIKESEIDGVYGSGTADAIKRFQKSVGTIAVDGITGTQTREYLANK